MFKLVHTKNGKALAEMHCYTLSNCKRLFENVSANLIHEDKPFSFNGREITTVDEAWVLEKK